MSPRATRQASLPPVNSVDVRKIQPVDSASLVHSFPSPFRFFDPFDAFALGPLSLARDIQEQIGRMLTQVGPRGPFAEKPMPGSSPFPIVRRR